MLDNCYALFKDTQAISSANSEAEAEMRNCYFGVRIFLEYCKKNFLLFLAHFMFRHLFVIFL